MTELIKKLFPISNDDIKRVRDSYNKTADDVKEDMAIIKVWIKQQLHLPNEQDDDRLERFLVRNKFSLERTKVKLETYYTARGSFMEYTTRSADLKTFLAARRCFNCIPLPNLTPQLERVYITNWTEDDSNYNLGNIICYIMALLEIELSYEYTVGTVHVFDLNNIKLSHYTKTDPNELLKFIPLQQDAYSGRITSIEFINAPSFMNLFLTLLKLVTKPKLFSKITVHKNMESLYKRIPKDYLPIDYGGAQRSFEEINDDVFKMLKENIGFLSERTKQKMKLLEWMGVLRRST